MATGYPSIDKPWMKYYDTTFDERNLPKQTIYELAYSRNKDNLSNIAIDVRMSGNDFNKGITITYKELFARIEKCAKAASVLGIGKDEIVPIILPNVPEARIFIYANSILGATSYPISPFLPEKQLELIINENNIRHVVLFEAFYDKYKSVLANTNLEHMILLDGTESMPQMFKMIKGIKDSISGAAKHSLEIVNKVLYWDRFMELSKQCRDIKPVSYSEKHIAAIIGTSGTTGTSKGVCLSDDNINATACAYIEGKCFGGSFLDALIPSIGYGISVLHHQTVAGAKVYLIPELVTDRIAEVVCKTKPDNFPGGPVHYINLARSKEFAEGTLPKVKNMISGGASLPKEIEEKLNGVSVGYEEEGINDNIFVRQGFGLSENVATGTYSKRGAYKFGSIGIPIPYETISIFKPDTDEELTYGETGEICITGPMVMQHYLNNPTETENVIHIHKDGKRWIHTKDIGYMDEIGHLFHVERIKNIFMRTGFNVHPSAISEFINTLPYVINSHVIGFDHPAEQCVPIAFVVADKTCGKRNEEIENLIKEECYKNLEETSVPYGYVFVDELPVNLGGKIDGQAIKEASEIDLMKSDSIPKKELHFNQ
ncbi:MAG: AMP-binding protein [Acutalibacter sp.]|nr:AMP-binding protein [Acutalibacter sp.]